MNFGKLLKKVVKKAKENPEIALAIVGMAPGVVKKVAPIIVAAAVTKDSDVM